MAKRSYPSLLAISAASAALALTLAGCSGGSSTTEPEDGPLGKYMSALWGNEEWTQEQADEENKIVEEFVAQCMQEEGFEYEPNLQNGGIVMSSDDDGPQWGTEEFAKEFGYGMSTDPWGNSEPSFDEEEYFDPNEEYVNSLSDSEREVYYEVLYGPGPTEEQMAEMEETGGWESDWTQQGCSGAAYHQLQEETQSAAAAYDDPEFTDLFDSMNSMYEEIWSEDGPQNDELIKLDADWADCMADKGYEFSSPMDANMKLSEEMNEIYSSSWGSDEGEEYVEPSEAEMAEMQAKLDAELKKFQPREIEVATADFECKDKLGYDKKQQKVQFEIEQKFVDQNKAALDALVAKYGADKK